VLQFFNVIVIENVTFQFYKASEDQTADIEENKKPTEVMVILLL